MHWGYKIPIITPHYHSVMNYILKNLYDAHFPLGYNPTQMLTLSTWSSVIHIQYNFKVVHKLYWGGCQFMHEPRLLYPIEN
jgi:hypothetical protein